MSCNLVFSYPYFSSTFIYIFILVEYIISLVYCRPIHYSPLLTKFAQLVLINSSKPQKIAQLFSVTASRLT